MTTIDIKDGYIEVKGHSGYAEVGKDIVCAAISVLTEATYNYLLATHNDVEKKENEGEFTIIIRGLNEVGYQIIKSFGEMIDDIASQYPENVRRVE